MESAKEIEILTAEREAFASAMDRMQAVIAQPKAAPQDGLRKAAQMALESLEDSIDTVRHEYETDWRHGYPTREAQLNSMKKMVDAHEAAIEALRKELGQE